MGDRQDGPIRGAHERRSDGEAGLLPEREWLVLRTSAVLESVATENYIRNRGCARPLYPEDAGQESDFLAALKVDLALRGTDASSQNVMQGVAHELHLACRGVTLTHRESSPDQVVWRGYQRARHLQVAWIWDFYRIQSHVMLRVLLGKHHQEPDGVWAETVRALNVAKPGGSADVRGQLSGGRNSPAAHVRNQGDTLVAVGLIVGLVESVSGSRDGPAQGPCRAAAHQAVL